MFDIANREVAPEALLHLSYGELFRGQRDVAEPINKVFMQQRLWWYRCPCDGTSRRRLTKKCVRNPCDDDGTAADHYSSDEWAAHQIAKRLPTVKTFSPCDTSSTMSFVESLITTKRQR